MRTYQALVCEDQLSELQFICRELEGAFQKNKLPVHFETYQNSKKVLEKLSQNEQHYDLLFFDIEMPGLNGIELCRRIRHNHPDSLVIFISNKEELVFQTFEVQPFRFIRKNHFLKELDQLVLAIEKELAVREGIQISVQELHSSTIYTWNINQILYVEALAKRCQVVTEHGSTNLQYRFMNFEDQLTPHGFLKPHQSFLVNCKYISVIEKDAVLLDNGERIPLSRNRVSEVKQQFMQYINGGSHAI